MANREPSSSWNSTAEILGGVLSQLPQAGRVHEYRVWEVWEGVVGEAVARKARPSRIQHGKLFVTVSHAVLMQELQFSKAKIKARLNEKLGSTIVREIFWVTGDVRAEAFRPATPPRRPLPPRTELSVPAVGNPEIERAFTAVLAARQQRLTEEGGKRRRG
jgi:predicted nucleic acid-binding Zn ribbon protein